MEATEWAPTSIGDEMNGLLARAPEVAERDDGRYVVLTVNVYDGADNVTAAHTVTVPELWWEYHRSAYEAAAQSCGESPDEWRAADTDWDAWVALTDDGLELGVADNREAYGLL